MPDRIEFSTTISYGIDVTAKPARPLSLEIFKRISRQTLHPIILSEGEGRPDDLK